MKIKALFFDIDGTLVSFQTHRIPQSAVDALAEAKRRGVKIFISTGRPIPFITNLGQISDLIDGYITTNGALCVVGEEQFGCHAMLKTDVKTILEACGTYGKSCVVVGARHIAAFQVSEALKKQFGVMLGLHDFPFYPLEEVLQEPILQVSPFFSPEEEAAVMPRLRQCVSGRWIDTFADITHRDADKGKGLEAMVAHERLETAETAAFGDGGNDISIIRRAGIGIAMGNAGDNVKEAADLVTASVDDDGISKALDELKRRGDLA